MGEDEEATVRTLTGYREMMATLIQKHRGRVVDSPGDNLLAEFASVLDAVRCAVEIQEELKARNADLPDDRKMEFRIGINLGDVIEEGERIYGDGVNIAARVEGLAEAGGICISGTVYEHIKDKLALWEEFLGEHTVKNIKEPVQVYRVRMGPGAEAPKVSIEETPGPRRWKWVAFGAVAVLIVMAAAVVSWKFYLRSAPTPVEVASVEKMAFPLPDKPSIAVLPFVNMSGDPEQEYFSDGMAEDLTTDLSKISSLLVISRNSAFAYKGKSVPIKQIAEQLGVRYVLEGSVRKAGEEVRINAQLVEATTGHHLWADRYDGSLKDIFALQNKVTQKIVSALAVQLKAGEQEKVTRKETDNIEAYDAFLKGWRHYRQWTPEDFREAIPYFEKAIELDPNYGRAHAALASIYLENYLRIWDWPQVLGFSGWGSFEQAGKSLQAAMKNPTPLAHRVASKRLILLLYHEEAIAEAEQAIALDPNDADGYAAMAHALIYSGKSEEAVGFVKDAMRLDPHSLANYLYILGLTHFGMEQFQEAATLLERAFKLNPEMGLLRRVYLAVAYVYLGQEEKARAELDKPEIDVRDIYDYWTKNLVTRYKNPKDRDRLLDGLAKVGLK
jgi:TolB-like protein